jgi:LPS sulfotransferase NodH
MFTITKTPVLILSTPRSGSTALGAYIKSLCKKDIYYFQEPDYYGQPEINNFKKYFYSNPSKNFILKCHFINLHRYGTDVSPYLLDNAYKIRIRRKDFVKQIASFYIAKKRDHRWHFENAEQLNFVDTIPINTLHIKQYITYIKDANYKLDHASVNFDLDLYYEDLPDINDAGYYIAPKPDNYNELLATIQELIRD